MSHLSRGILDWLGMRRNMTRYDLRCMVDVQMADTGSYVGFCARDISLSGLYMGMLAPQPDVLEQIRSEKKLFVKVRLPQLYGVVDLQARLVWDRIEKGELLTGWRFVQIKRANLKKICAYMSDHPEKQIVNDAQSEARRGQSYGTDNAQSLAGSLATVLRGGG